MSVCLSPYLPTYLEGFVLSKWLTQLELASPKSVRWAGRLEAQGRAGIAFQV